MTPSAWSPNGPGSMTPRAILGPRKGLLIPCAFGGARTRTSVIPRSSSINDISSIGDDMLPPLFPRAALRQSVSAPSTPRDFPSHLIKQPHEEASAAQEPPPPTRHDSKERTTPRFSLAATRSHGTSDAYDAAALHTAPTARFALREKTMTHPASRLPPMAGNNMDRERRSARWRLGAAVFAIERSVAGLGEQTEAGSFRQLEADF